MLSYWVSNLSGHGNGCKQVCCICEQSTKVNNIFIDNPIISPIYGLLKWKETNMTDMSKYKNVSLTKETYATLDKLSKVLLPDAKLSIAKTIESIANEKAKKLNGKIKKS